MPLPDATIACATSSSVIVFGMIDLHTQKLPRLLSLA
jgi:hypothetical protein